MTPLDLTLSAEQQELRATVAKFLAVKAPLLAQRELLATDSGFDPTVWTQLAEQLGLVGLVIPEKYGGLGFGPIELYVVLHEMGRTLYSGPYLPSVLAATTLLRSGSTEACERLLPDIASGQAIATLAWAEHDGWTSADIATTARKVGDGWLVDGVKTLVLGVPAADVFLVTAHAPDGVALFAVEAAPTVVDTAVLEALDLTRRIGTVQFSTAPATLISSPDRTPAILEGVLDVALAAMAAEQSGGAWACLEMSVEHAKTRVQFGAPIGSYQAVAHTCAQMLLQAEHARSAAHYAAATTGTPEHRIAATAAAAYAGQAFNDIATATIHVHGGIGFTWEHDAHLYFRRARSSALFFGTPDQHYASIATAARL